MKITEVERGLSNLDLAEISLMNEEDMMSLNGGSEEMWCICYRNHKGCILVDCLIRIGCGIRHGAAEVEEYKTIDY